MRLPRIEITALPALWLVLSFGLSSAGQSDTGGSVAGRVMDGEGRGVSAAEVLLEDAAAGEHSETVCDLRGNFRFAEVAPGDYTLRVHADGLSEWEADHLTVGLGTTAYLTARLAPSWVHRTVLVDAEAANRRESAAEAAGSRDSLADQVPNNSGHWSSLAMLFSGSTTGEDGGSSFRGLSPLMNSIGRDGMNNTLAFRSRERGTEGNGFATAQSAVGEIRAGGEGSAGDAAGGVMSTVTKRGANRMHGQGVFYDRGAIGQAFNAFSKTMVEEPAGTTVSASGQPVLYLNGQTVTYVEVPYHAPDRRQQGEVSAGGPIRRDRLWWFFAWSRHERNDPAVARANEPEVFFAPPSAASLTTLEARIAASTNPLLKGCPAAGSAGSGSTARAECAWTTVLGQLNGMLGTVPRSTRQTILFPKIEWRVNPRNQIVAQYNSMRRTAPHGVLGGASETDAIGSFGNSSTSDDSAVARWEFFATPRLLSRLSRT